MMEYKIVEMEQRSQEWLDFRKGKIGASMIASIMGLNPFQTRLELWEDIVFEKEKTINEAMKRGIDGEEAAVEWINFYCIPFKYAPIVIQSIEYPWMMASLDAAALKNGKLDIFEIKHPSKTTHEISLQYKVPSYYQPQLQWQMYIAGVERMTYLSCYQGNYVPVEVKIDYSFVDVMVKDASDFRQSLIDFVPPPPSEKDVIQVLDYELFEKANRYKEIDRLMRELDGEQERIRKELIQARKHPRFDIGDLKVRRIPRKGAIDYNAIPELKGVDLEPYRKSPSDYWRLSY